MKTDFQKWVSDFKLISNQEKNDSQNQNICQTDIN